MIKVIVLIMFFHDGYLGGQTTAAYFHKKDACEKFGRQQAAQNRAWGHPTTFVCEPSTLPKERERIVR